MRPPKSLLFIVMMLSAFGRAEILRIQPEGCPEHFEPHIGALFTAGIELPSFAEYALRGNLSLPQTLRDPLNSVESGPYRPGENPFRIVGTTTMGGSPVHLLGRQGLHWHSDYSPNQFDQVLDIRQVIVGLGPEVARTLGWAMLPLSRESHLLDSTMITSPRTLDVNRKLDIVDRHLVALGFEPTTARFYSGSDDAIYLDSVVSVPGQIWLPREEVVSGNPESAARSAHDDGTHIPTLLMSRQHARHVQQTVKLLRELSLRLTRAGFSDVVANTDWQGIAPPPRFTGLIEVVDNGLTQGSDLTGAIMQGWAGQTSGTSDSVGEWFYITPRTYNQMSGDGTVERVTYFLDVKIALALESAMQRTHLTDFEKARVRQIVVQLFQEYAALGFNPRPNFAETPLQASLRRREEVRQAVLRGIQAGDLR